MHVLSTGKGQILLEAMNGSAILERLPEGFQLPHELLAAGKIEEGSAAYRKLHATHPQAKSIAENVLNDLGYEMMNAHKTDAALAIFELNTTFYPDGFNTWDSLAEWHMNAGDKAKAIEYYRKSVALNPGNENGKKMLKKLE